MTAVLGQMAEQPKDGGSPLIGTPGVATPPSLLHRARIGRDPQEGAEVTPLKTLDRRVVVVAGVAFVVMMALSGLYGYDRDELYFLDAARHLQGGYVDQPVLAPLLARVSLSLFGVSLPGLRLWPSLALAATVVVGGLLARGARRWPSSAVPCRRRDGHHARAPRRRPLRGPHGG